LEQKIVAAESVIYVAQQFNELRHHLPDIEDVRDYFENTIGCIENLRDPIFMTSCDKAINSDVILPLMSKVAWDIREVRSQHSQYVDILLREMQIFSIRVQTLSEKVFISPEVLKSLWAMCAFAAGSVFVEGFSCAKKCSNEGRALMQLDFRHFVMKMERIAEIKPLPYQDFVANYVKAFYIPESELEQWVKQHPEYTSKQLVCLINSVAYSNNKTKQKLNQMVHEISDKIRSPKVKQ